VLFARLKQLRKLGCTVFSFGESLTTFDYSLGSSLENFFLFFRFRARSAVLAGDAVYITSSKLFRNFSTFFSSKSVLALEESPATACSTEFGLRLTCSRASKWDLLFSPYASGTSAFTIPVAHFYETKSLLFSSLSPTLVCAESTLPSAYFFYDLFTSFFYESQFAVPAALPTSLADDKTTPRFDVPVQAASVYSTYNYYDHFFGHAALRNSTNILLTLRRNEDYRHTHLCSF